MPEGDTIYRAAATLHRALAGQPVVRFESVFPALTRVHDDHPLTAMTVDKVESIGKHLLMHFSGGLVLRTHMRMNGSWHIYRPGERWRQQRARHARAGGDSGLSKRSGSTFPSPSSSKHRDLETARGPGQARSRRARRQLRSRQKPSGACARRPSSPVADALLNQRLLAGLGNVCKSEVLFACGINPFVTVATLSDQQLEASGRHRPAPAPGQRRRRHRRRA